jgi:DNA primase
MAMQRPRRRTSAPTHPQAGEAARAYIAKRGLAPENVEQFGLGYSIAWPRWCVSSKARISIVEMEEADWWGSVRRQPFDRFRNRLMFPSTTKRERSSRSAVARFLPRTSLSI